MVRVIRLCSILAFVLVAGTLALLPCAVVMAQSPGDLLVAPTRLVLTDRQRTGELLLMNAGTTTATYRITFTHLRMNELGGMQAIATPSADELFCDDIVRFSPRQVTLEPKSSQTIRLQLRLPADLAAGEYRSHLQLKAIPQNPPPSAGKQADAAQNDVTVHLVATFGVSIPVIVRHGHTSATATMSDLSIAPGATPDEPMILSAVISRSGNQSVYGDLIATFPGGKGRPAVIANVGGVAVYTPNAKRVVKLELKPPKGAELRAGRITLSYREKPADGGKLIAEGSVEIP